MRLPYTFDKGSILIQFYIDPRKALTARGPLGRRAGGGGGAHGRRQVRFGSTAGHGHGHGTDILKTSQLKSSTMEFGGSAHGHGMKGFGRHGIGMGHTMERPSSR